VGTASARRPADPVLGARVCRRRGVGTERRAVAVLFPRPRAAPVLLGVRPTRVARGRSARGGGSLGDWGGGPAAPGQPAGGAPPAAPPGAGNGRGGRSTRGPRQESAGGA